MTRGTDGPRGLKSLGGPGVPLTSIVYGPPFGRNAYTTMIILPQINRVKGFWKRIFFSFFRQANGTCCTCSWLGDTEF